MNRNPKSEIRNPRSGGSVHLHIERLVLDGFALNAAAGVRLRVSIERELGRMLASTRADSWNGSATQHLQATPVHLAPVNSPAVWGRQIARTLLASFAPQPPAGLASQSNAAVPQPSHTKSS